MSPSNFVELPTPNKQPPSSLNFPYPKDARYKIPGVDSGTLHIDPSAEEVEALALMKRRKRQKTPRH